MYITVWKYKLKEMCLQNGGETIQAKNVKSNLFEVIAETHRRNIIDLLRIQPRTVGELVDRCKLSQPGISKHLKILREAGLVTMSRDGQRRIYHLDAQPLREIHTWIEPYRSYWSDRLDALERILDEEE